ncbi:MAG: hypothetical protein ACQESC_01815, partial [Nanobdellota archaeon]
MKNTLYQTKKASAGAVRAMVVAIIIIFLLVVFSTDLLGNTKNSTDSIQDGVGDAIDKQDPDVFLNPDDVG